MFLASTSNTCAVFSLVEHVGHNVRFHLRYCELSVAIIAEKVHSDVDLMD